MRMTWLIALMLFPVSWLSAEEKKDTLEATVRKLEKDIAAARGLEFKKPVNAKIIPRPAEAAKGIQGYYNIKEKALFVYDDIKGNYERGVLIHEMVHALQDQHFGLAQLHQASFGSESELALAALIEGDATYTMIEVLQKEQPRVAMMLAAPLEKSRNFRNAFLYAQGARYVKALKEKGGWAAVNAAYKNPPRTTAAVLFPGTFRSTVALGPGTTKGALSIIETLATNEATSSLSMESARSWKGDRNVEDPHGQVWEVACTTLDDAKRFQQAMVKLYRAKFADMKDLFNGPEGNAWIEEKGTVRAVLIQRDLVRVIDAPSELAFRIVRNRLESPPVWVWSTKDKQVLTFGQFMDRLLAYDLVCVGETHDSVAHHRVQLQIIKGLFARDERLGVGMEMFQRPYQNTLDWYIRGEIAEEAFLTASEYRQRWGFDWELYRPITDFCRRNSIPLAALNAPRELTQRLSKVGHAELTPDEKKQLGDIDFQVKEHRDHWFELLAKMHGNVKVTPEQKERSYQVMTAWDGFMAASAAKFQQERRLRRMIVLAGSGHIDRGFGIPNRAAKLTNGKAVTIHIEAGGDPAKAIAEPTTDFIVFTETKRYKPDEKK